MKNHTWPGPSGAFVYWRCRSQAAEWTPLLWILQAGVVRRLLLEALLRARAVAPPERVERS